MQTKPAEPVIVGGKGAERLPSVVWAAGWVSFFTDLSTELIYGVLPAFYSATLHLSIAWLGLIEGFAEGLVAVTKLLSGRLSDRTGGRKWWMVGGYGLSTLSKPLLPWASGGVTVLLLRGADRLGKGVRGAPRDAVIAGVIAPNQRGRAFGVQRALDHAGALTGGLLAATLLYMRWVTLDQLFYWTLLPGGIAVLLIVLLIHEPADQASPLTPQAAAGPGSEPLGPLLRHQHPSFRRYLVVLSIFALGNSSDMLLLMLAHDRFQAAGLDVATATAALPLLWAWLHVSKSLTAAWGGRLSDRIGRVRTLRAGWLVYVLVYVGFACWTAAIAPWLLFAAYGLYYGLTEGAERALVADLSGQTNKHGTAYGLYYCVTGIAALPASVLVALLWTLIGPATAFLTGAALAGIATLLLPWALAPSGHDAGGDRPASMREGTQKKKTPPT